MNSQELQGALRQLKSLLNQRGEISDAQQRDIRRLREKVRQLESEKQRLEAERQRLTRQVNQLTSKPSSE